MPILYTLENSFSCSLHFTILYSIELEQNNKKQKIFLIISTAIFAGLIILIFAIGYVSYKRENSREKNLIGNYGEILPTIKQSQKLERPIEIPEFNQETVLENLQRPWDIIFFEDNSFIFTERNNKINYYDGSTLHQVGTGRDLSLLSDTYVNGEGGMLGLALDPKFDENNYIYACFNSTISGNVDVRVARFEFDKENPTLSNREDIITGLPSITSGRHSGCQLEFGPDGYLWVSTGDAATGTNPQSPTILGGKILRIDRNGNSAPGNLEEPFDPRIFSYGHRNPQGLGFFTPNIGFPVPGINIEHGPGMDDEVNALVKGNFGWNPVPNPYNEGVPMTDINEFPDAIESIWSSGTPTDATSGGTIIHGSEWKAWEEAIIVAGQRSEKIIVIEVDFNLNITRETEIFKNELGRIRTIQQDLAGNLYILTDNGQNDSIIKLSPK